MRHFTEALCAGMFGAGMLCTGLVMGADQVAPATQPAASALVSVPVPGGEVARAPAVEAGTVLVLPYAQALGTNYPWLSRALQQDLQVELSRSSRAAVVAPAAFPPAVDADSALKAAREARATLVVYGQYQSSGDQVRISGSVVDVATGKSGGSFTATGGINNLFPLEDSVAGQVLRALPSGWVTVALPPVNAAGEASGEPAKQSAIITQPPQYYSYPYPNYSAPQPAYPYYYYDYSYPYNWYTVPYYGPDIYLFGGWGFYPHHFWDHRWGGFHDGGFDHGSFGGHFGGEGHVGGGGHAGGGGAGHR